MSKTPEILWSATRQYKHNNGDEDFVIAFEQEETIKIVERLQDRIAKLELEKAELQGNWDRCFNSRAEYIRENAELEQQLAQEREANRWIPVIERLPEPYKKDLDGLRTVSDIVICKDHLNTFWTDQTYRGYDGKPFWASLKCSCVGWKPIELHKVPIEHCECGDVGFFIVPDGDGDPMQERCKFCYTVPWSFFNVMRIKKEFELRNMKTCADESVTPESELPF